MSKTTENNGRLCNQIIRNLAMSLLAEKNNLLVYYSSKDRIDKLGINLYIGKNIFSNTIDINNSNYISFLNKKEKIESNLNLDHDYFQSEEITDILFNYLKNHKENIIKVNPYNLRYNNNTDLFIHIRLSDAERWNPGINYYLETIDKINFNEIYIASDSPRHKIIKNIRKKYPNAKIIDNDEIKTIQFGSTCKNVVLSHGSYSSVIGYLSFFSEVYFPNKEPKWCPLGMFTNKNWNPVNF